jgi:hypothetical protein
MAGEEFIGRRPIMAAFAAQAAEQAAGRGSTPLVVLTGVSGIGKSMLAAQLLAKLPPKTVVVRLDWDYGPPEDRLGFAQRIAQAIDDQCGAATAFRRAQHTRMAALSALDQHRARHPLRWREAEDASTVRGIGDLARGALPAGPIADAAGEFAQALAIAAERRFAGWLHSRNLVDDEAYAALADPAGYLARALTADLRRMAAKRLLVIWQDSCEHVREQLDYLTAELVAPLRGHRVLWLVGGQWLGPGSPADPVPRWSRPVADAVLLAELRPFTDAELAELAADDRITAGWLREETFGIPLLAAIALRRGDWPSGYLLHVFTDRLLGRLAESDLLYLSVLAMTGGHPGHPVVSAICADLGLHTPRLPMLRAGELDPLIAAYLRDRLLRDDAFAAMRSRVARRYLDHARERWRAAAREHPDFATRLRAEPVLNAATDYCAASFWWTFGDGCRETIQLWAETLASGDERAATRLLAAATQFTAAVPADLPERRLLRLAAAVSPSPVPRQAGHNDAALVSQARELVTGLGYPDSVVFALDVYFANLALLRGVGDAGTPALLRRHAALPELPREGLRCALGMLSARYGYKVLSAGRLTTELARAAAPSFRAAAELVPRDDSLQRDVAKVLFCAGDETAAAVAALRAIALAPRDPDIVLPAMDVLWKLGHAAACTESVASLALMRPDDPRVARHGYWQALRAGNFAEAAQWLCRVARAGTLVPPLQAPGSAPEDRARALLRRALAAHLAGDPADEVAATLAEATGTGPAEPGYEDLIVCVCDVCALARTVCPLLEAHDGDGCAAFHSRLDAARETVERLPWRTVALDRAC